MTTLRPGHHRAIRGVTVFVLHHQWNNGIAFADGARSGGKQLKLGYAMKVRHNGFVGGHFGHRRLRAGRRAVRRSWPKISGGPMFKACAGRMNHVAFFQRFGSAHRVDHYGFLMIL